jgi:hypothetical protein
VGAFSQQMASIKTLVEPWITANIEEGVKLVSPHIIEYEKKIFLLFFKVLKYCMCCLSHPCFIEEFPTFFLNPPCLQLERQKELDD